jgi:hypothetical protein
MPDNEVFMVFFIARIIGSKISQKIKNSSLSHPLTNYVK